VALQNQVLIYPNPASDQVTVDLTTMSIVGNVTIRVVDLSGRMISETQTSAAITMLETSQWQKGTYLVYIQSGENRVVKKLVIL
jgi:hypothetical protein